MSSVRVVASACFVMASATLAPVSKAFGQHCPGVAQAVPVEQRSAYVRQISSRTSGHPKSQLIHLDHYMQSGDWSAIFATPPGAERGVFFFHLHGRVPELRDVWGGVAGGDSNESIAQWTLTLSPTFPKPLALCFAQMVTAGE